MGRRLRPAGAPWRSALRGTWLSDCCSLTVSWHPRAQGGCNQCCYVFCCMSCAYGKIAGSLPPGRRVLSAAHLRACNFFKEHLAWRCSRWPNAPHAIYSACLAGNECGACVSYAAVRTQSSVQTHNRKICECTH
jgi:hypothetical protein